MTPGARPAARGPHFDPQGYRDPAPQPWLIRLLGPVNRHVILPRVLRIRELDLPAADLARLGTAVNPTTAAFLGPNHPEFMTDWMIDKELAHRCSPLMAHWAAHEIVNGSPLAQRFWLANRLIANVPGGGGKAYSVRTALAGDGVLLHPEGTATWQAERVGPLRPGIIEMAQACVPDHAAGTARPIFVVPIVWRLRFIGDAGPGLHGQISHIERELRLPSSVGSDLPDRFAGLLIALLQSRAAQLGLRAPELDPFRPGEYFAAQARALEVVRARLAQHHGAIDTDLAVAQRALRNSIRLRAEADPAGAREDRGLLLELQRLTRLDPRLYDKPTLTQEQMAEVLQATRSALVTRGWRNALHNTIPRAAAARIAHVRVPEPIDIRAATAAGTSSDALLTELHARLQRAVDALGRELAPAVDPFRRPNLLDSREASSVR